MPNYGAMLPEIRSAYKAALAKLGEGAKPLYHQTNDVQGLMSGPRVDLGMNEAWKPSGLYASDNLFDNLMSRVGEGGTLTNMKEDVASMNTVGRAGFVRMVPKPNATMGSINEADLIAGQPHPNTDIVKLMNVDEGNVPAEYIVRNLKAVSMFSKDKVWNPMVAGMVGGGLAGAVLGQPDQAEAMPLGNFVKQTPKKFAELAEKTLRSESNYDRLLGMNLNLGIKGRPRQPYEVIDIRKNPKNDWRYVVVKDAEGNRHQLPMTKDYMEVLSGAKGTQDYTQQFDQLGLKGKDYQASKSLGIRQAKRDNGPIEKDSEFKSWNASQAAKAKEIDPALLNDYHYVQDPQGRMLYLPSSYAEHLATRGEVKIIGKGTGNHTPPKPKATRAKRESQISDEELAARIHAFSLPGAKTESLGDKFRKFLKNALNIEE